MPYARREPRAKARASRSSSWVGAKRSAQIQRTISQPRSRNASSRRFSSNNACSGLCPGRSRSRPYLLRPSNSPRVRCSRQPKSDRPTSCPERAKTSSCGSGGGMRCWWKNSPAHRLSRAFAARVEQGQRPPGAGNAAATTRVLHQLSELLGLEAVAQRGISDGYGMQRIQRARQIDDRAGQAGDPEAVDLDHIAVRRSGCSAGGRNAGPCPDPDDPASDERGRAAHSRSAGRAGRPPTCDSRPARETSDPPWPPAAAGGWPEGSAAHPPGGRTRRGGRGPVRRRGSSGPSRRTNSPPRPGPCSISRRSCPQPSTAGRALANNS